MLQIYEKMLSYQLQNTTWPIRFGSTPSGDKIILLLICFFTYTLQNLSPSRIHLFLHKLGPIFQMVHVNQNHNSLITLEQRIRIITQVTTYSG